MITGVHMIRMFKITYFIGAFIGFAAFSSFSSHVAFGASITAEVDRLKTGSDEPFWLTVSIEGDLEGDVQVPESQDFEFTRTGESTNISIVNGSISKERQYTYQVSPLKSGALTIPPLKAKIDGKEYSSLPIKVDVIGQASGPKDGQAADNKKLVFVERELPKKILYEGESMVSTVRLLTRARLTGATPARDSAPDWRLIAVDGQKNQEVLRNGMTWNTIEMREGLIPLKTGRLKVPAFGITATWIQPADRTRRAPTGSVFDLFQQGVFNMGREVTRTLRSDPVEVEVRPLPKPKPKEFADIVGAFNLSSSVSKRELNAGDTVTVTLEIKGQGALDRMNDIKISPIGSKVYADRPDLKEKIEPGAGLVSVRTLKFAVVPAITGSIDLGEVKIASFNPFTEEYEVLNTQLGKINVNGDSTSTASAITPSTVVQEQNSNEISDGGKTVLEKGLVAESKLEPTKVDTLTEPSKSWWLTPWVLAFEFLLFVLITSWLLIRRSFPKSSVKGSDLLASNPWRDLKVDLSRESFFPEVMNLLKLEFSKNGCVPKALTSEDILASDLCDSLPKDIRLALQRFLELYDRVTYGQSRFVNLPEDVAHDINQLVAFYRNRKSS